MKKLLLLFVLLTMVCIANAQSNRVQSISELNSLGFSTGSIEPAGSNGSVALYSASFIGAGLKGMQSGRCKQGVGCCKKGQVIFDDAGRIYSVKGKGGFEDQCEMGPIENGFMYKSDDEIWIAP